MEGIIFDMDGTMVDNMMVHHRAWQRKLSSLGHELTIEEVKAEIHGVNEEIIKRLFGDRFTAEERSHIAWEKEKEYRDIYVDQIAPIPGLISFLDQLKEEGLPLAIGTAAPPENVDLVLDQLDIRSRFKSVLHSRNVSNGKPNPEIFLRSAENLGIAIENCLVIEDSVVGAQTALNAGCPVIIVTTTHQQQEFKHFPHILMFINDYEGLNIENIRGLI